MRTGIMSDARPRTWNESYGKVAGKIVIVTALLTASAIAALALLGRMDGNFGAFMGGAAFAIAIAFLFVQGRQAGAIAAARKAEEVRLSQLLMAVEQSPASVVITDTDGIIEYVNPRFTALTGFASDEAIGRKTSIVKSGRTPNEVYRDLWKTLRSGKTWQGEFLNRKKNGELYWEEAVMAPVTGPDGQVASFIAVKSDVTERKKIEHALRASEERFRQLVMAAPDAVVGVDGAGSIVFANQETETLLGYAGGELVGRPVECLVPEARRGTHGEHRSRFVSRPAPRTMGMGRALSARHVDGREIPVEINLSHSMTDEGPLVIAFMRDITERVNGERKLQEAYHRLEEQVTEIQSLQASLREQAIRDPLTHLYNRRLLDEVLDRELSLAARHALALSVILIDIDHFKAVNDTHGHAAGDECLVALARLLQHKFRGTDLVFRHGGEEFLIVVPGTDAESARMRAEDVRQQASDLSIRHEGREVRFTLSAGVASFPLHGEDADKLVQRADQALYASKRGGRNRVTVWANGGDGPAG